MNKIKSILITKFKNIGDVLLMTPAIRALKESYPQARIVVVVNQETEAMLLHNPHINQLLTYDREVKKKKGWEKIKEEISLVKKLRSENFDLSIEFSGGDRGAILSFLSGAKIRAGYAKGKRGLLGRNFLFTHLSHSNNTKKHMIEHNLDLLKEIKLRGENKNLVLNLSKEEEQETERLLASFKLSSLKDFIVTIHPTSRWFFKCWKDEYIACVSDYLVERYGAKVIFTSGPMKKELDKMEQINSLLKHKVINLAGKTRLRQLAGIIKVSQLFLGIDSAPMHIASALNIPSIILFGPSGHKHWGPLNPEATILVKDLPCIPCGKAGCNDSKESKCLDMITPDEVKKVIDEMLLKQRAIKNH
ncbi:putative lipopolysaccharide heptosyltransferase III [Candidatus Auribacterota bacterium]